jgi:stage II sporulation protein E
MQEKGGAVSRYKVYNINPKGEESIRKGVSILSSLGIGMLLITFLISRASILQGLTPFGLPFVAAVLIKNRKMSLVGLVSMVSIITAQGAKASLRYIGAILIYYLVYYLVSSSVIKKKVNLSLYQSGAIIAFSLFGTSLIRMLFSTVYIYDLVIVSFETVMIFVGTLIFSYGIDVIREFDKRKILSTEELLSLIITLAVTVMGFGSLQFLGYSLINLLGVLIIMVFAYNWGSTLGCSAGIIIGVITSISIKASPEIVGMYGFAGLLSGSLKDLGKYSSGIGFLLGTAILTLYSTGGITGFTEFKEILIAALILIMIPNKMLNYLTRFKGVSQSAFEQRKYGERLREVTTRRLNELSSVFQQLSATFNQMGYSQVPANTCDVSELIDSIAKRVCGNCAMYNNCWQDSFYASYQRMFDVITISENKAKITSNDLPQFFKDSCVRTAELCKWVNYYVELYKINVGWGKKVEESRNLVSQQLNGVSKVIFQLAKEINIEASFDNDIEDLLMVELDRAGIRVDEVMATQNSNKAMEITICKKNCGERGECSKAIAPVVSKALNKYFVKSSKVCSAGKDNKCVIKLVEPVNYNLITGVSKFSPSGEVVSGDNHTFMELKDGKYMIALSDGMGIGAKANRESSNAISLLEQLIEAGFNKDVTISTINSMLMLKSADETFTTMDMTIIDQYKGEGEFVKIGAAPTYIKREVGVEVINAATLPIGILESVDMEVTTRRLIEGDFVIMLSDGILECVDRTIKDDWLRDFIEEIDTKNPQEMADLIFEEALRMSGNKVKDDMTVIVSKIRKVRG